MSKFQLDPVLAGDTIRICSLRLCHVLAMDDARWPWLILVPARAGVTEIHELDEMDQQLLAMETALVAGNLKRHTNCEKINTGALGNVVRQLHVHVVARSNGDPNWPGPVWGVAGRTRYESGKLQPFADGIAETLIHEAAAVQCGKEPASHE